MKSYHKASTVFAKSCIFLCLLSCFPIFSQEKEEFQHTINVISDNDAYAALENFDRYYTYGLGLKWSTRPERFLGLQKQLAKKTDYFVDFQVISQGFTPTRQVVSVQEVQEDTISFERPFAGVLYGQLGVVYTFERSFLRAEFLAGIMGPSALSSELQDWIHENITGDDLLDGWEFQIPDQFIFNLNLKGVYDFTPEAKVIDVFGMGRVRAGNLYIDASPTIGVRLGKFGAITTSSAFGNVVLAPRSIKEFYLKSTVSGVLTFFNGTAQGNIFDKDFEYAVQDINHFHTEMSHGLYFRRNRYSLGFDQVFTFGKVLKGVRHMYGRIHMEYSF